MKYIAAFALALVLVIGSVNQARAGSPFNFFGQSAQWMDTTVGTPTEMVIGVDHNGETIYVVVTVTTDAPSRNDIRVLMVGSNYAGHFTVNAR